MKITPQQIEALVTALGENVTAYAAGVHVNDLALWSGGYPVPAPFDDRLAVAHDTFFAVEAHEGQQVAIAWFTSDNLAEIEGAPAQAVREDRFDDLRAAVNAALAT